MSGPKSYTPPPRYSMQVFDGKLNEVFRLQSRLKLLRAELEACRLDDAKLNISFDCREALNNKRKMLDKALKALVFDYRGTFGQETYNRIDAEIRKRIAELQNSLHECELIKHEFDDRKSDYEAYRAYLLFYENSKLSFGDFKNQIRQYLKKNLETKSPEIFRETDAQIERVIFEKPQTAFSFGFEKRAESEKQAVVNHILEREKIIYRLKDATGERVRLSAQDAKTGSLTAEKTGIVEKIETLIRRCDDAAIRNDYERRLQKLKESEVLRDAFFFKQLHNSILDEEQTRRAKAAVAAVLRELGEIELHPSTENEKRNLGNLCFSLLDKSSLVTAETDGLRLKLKQVEKLSRERFEEEEISNRERLFLKSQIIVCLENLGYEVMDDLEVIDFEKENDFLLKIKNQDNYLNLKFKPDGSMRYIFQIPENENELSIDQQNLKLHEMQVTCDEFKLVLQDLSQMGLKIDLQSERPVASASIIRLPHNQRDKIKTRDRQQQQKTAPRLRERFLDR